MSQHVFSVELEQYDREGYLHHDSKANIRARTGQEAVKIALNRAKGNGYLKSRPIELKSVNRIVENLK